MGLEQWAYLAQIAGSVGVIVSLIFVGHQIRQNTAVLYRNEHNSTMAQWTVIRMAIVGDRDIAELMTAGLSGESTLDAADELRLDQLLNQHTWAAFHIWDRTQRGVFAKGTFEASGAVLLVKVLTTKGGAAWWRSARTTGGYFPGFVADLDALLANHAEPPQTPKS